MTSGGNVRGTFSGGSDSDEEDLESTPVVAPSAGSGGRPKSGSGAGDAETPGDENAPTAPIRSGGSGGKSKKSKNANSESDYQVPESKDV